MNNKVMLTHVLSSMSDLPEFVGLELSNANQKGNYGNFPIHVAATWNDVEAIKVLVKNGANVDSRGEGQMTPLHRAAEAGNRDAVSILLELGANPSLLDTSEASPLDLAKRMHKHLEDLLSRPGTAGW